MKLTVANEKSKEKLLVDREEIFNDQVLATAILDLLLHHCTTLNIKGESYRLKEKRKAGLFGSSAKPLEVATSDSRWKERESIAVTTSQGINTS